MGGVSRGGGPRPGVDPASTRRRTSGASSKPAKHAPKSVLRGDGARELPVVPVVPRRLGQRGALGGYRPPALGRSRGGAGGAGATGGLSEAFAAALRLVAGLLPGQDQYQLRRATDEPGLGLHPGGLRHRNVDLLRGLHPLRGAVEHAPLSGGRAQAAGAHHGGVGHCGGLDGGHHERGGLLHAARACELARGMRERRGD